MRVTVALSGDTGTLYIDGAPVVSGNVTLNPDDLGAKWGAIGVQSSGKNLFKGAVDDLAIYRAAFSDLASLSP